MSEMIARAWSVLAGAVATACTRALSGRPSQSELSLRGSKTLRSGRKPKDEGKIVVIDWEWDRFPKREGWTTDDFFAGD